MQSRGVGVTLSVPECPALLGLTSLGGCQAIRADPTSRCAISAPT